MINTILAIVAILGTAVAMLGLILMYLEKKVGKTFLFSGIVIMLAIITYSLVTGLLNK